MGGDAAPGAEPDGQLRRLFGLQVADAVPLGAEEILPIDDAITALTKKLLPMAEVVTPNIPEAEILSGLTITCLLYTSPSPRD